MFTKKTLTENDIALLKEKYSLNYQEQIKKVENGYPVQYLIGNVEFLNTTILVNPNVLIPRFETEYLVEKVLNRTKEYKEKPLKMLDICTGSGCIAIAIAKNTNWKCTGIDISVNALEVAKENAKLNGQIVQYVQFNILNQSLKNNYDIIISNPPYVKKGENLDISTQYEPQIALFAEQDGLIFYEKIMDSIKNNPILIAFEIGEEQGNTLEKMAKEKFPNAKITIEKDLNHKDRYLFIERN